MSFSTLHVILILTIAIFVSIVNTGNYCFRNCALQIIAHIPPLREHILDDKNTGVYTNVMRAVLRLMLVSQCAITVPLELFLVDPSFIISIMEGNMSKSWNCTIDKCLLLTIVHLRTVCVSTKLVAPVSLTPLLKT